MDGDNQQQPQPPDPAQFNLRDPQQLAEFYRANSAYNLAVVQREVQAALAPHQTRRRRQALAPIIRHFQQTVMASRYKSR